MEITVSHEQARVPVAVLHLQGSLVAEEELQETAQKLYDSGVRNMLIDLTHVPYIASAGLRALHYIYRLLRTDAPGESDETVKRGIAAGTWTAPHLKLLNPTHPALEVLKMTGYDMFLEIHRDRKKAIASF